MLVQPQPHVFSRPSEDSVTISLVLVALLVRLREANAMLNPYFDQLGPPPLSQCFEPLQANEVLHVVVWKVKLETGEGVVTVVNWGRFQRYLTACSSIVNNLTSVWRCTFYLRKGGSLKCEPSMVVVMSIGSSCRSTNS